MTETEAQMSGEHSNECEMLYMSCYPVDPTSLGTLSVLSHELEHLIHFGHDSNEESWLDEGCAEFAMVLFGQPDPISSFNTNSDNNLTAWNQDYSDYVKTMLFFTYLSEQTSGPSFITSLVANTLNGVTSIDAELSLIMFPLDFKQIFTNWTLANYIDDASIESGTYNYEILDLPAFTHKQYFTSYPATKTTTLKDCAAHYYRFSTDFTALDLSFQFPQAGEWDLNLITFEDDIVKEIIPIVGDNILFNYPETYILSKLVLVVTNKEIGTTTKTYTLNGNNMTGINNISQNNSVSVYPNPATDFVTVSLSNNDYTDVNVKVFNVFGQEVQNYSTVISTMENQSFELNTSGYNRGMYYLQVNYNGGFIVKKLLVE
jgi:signal peptidase I